MTKIVKTDLQYALHRELVVLENARGVQFHLYVNFSDVANREAHIVEATAILDQKEEEAAAYEKSRVSS